MSNENLGFPFLILNKKLHNYYLHHNQISKVALERERLIIYMHYPCNIENIENLASCGKPPVKRVNQNN
jgi:hypothetical protein